LTSFAIRWFTVADDVDFVHNFFTASIVNIIWKSLPKSVVDANSVNAFKARIDKFRLLHKVMFDYTGDLSGI